MLRNLGKGLLCSLLFRGFLFPPELRSSLPSIRTTARLPPPFRLIGENCSLNQPPLLRLLYQQNSGEQKTSNKKRITSLLVILHVTVVVSRLKLGSFPSQKFRVFVIRTPPQKKTQSSTTGKKIVSPKKNSVHPGHWMRASSRPPRFPKYLGWSHPTKTGFTKGFRYLIRRYCDLWGCFRVPLHKPDLHTASLVMAGWFECKIFDKSIPYTPLIGPCRKTLLHGVRGVREG